MKNRFETKRNVWEIVPCKISKADCMYEFQKGCKYKLYRITDSFNIIQGFFETKHACKEFAESHDF